MGRRIALAIVALATLLGGSALAAPPTVTPSPGYDARLQESRKATAATSNQPPTSANAPATPPHHPRRIRTH